MAGRRYARGDKAWGYCARSGRRMLLKDMVPDGYNKGLMVDPKWYDGPHPQEKLSAVDDPVAVRRPSPDRDTPLAVITFPTFNISNGQVNGSILEIDELDAMTVSITAATVSVWRTDNAAAWMVDNTGTTLVFNG